MQHFSVLHGAQDQQHYNISIGIKLCLSEGLCFLSTAMYTIDTSIIYTAYP